MGTDKSGHDETLGAALRELDVPNLSSSFEAELVRSLRAEAAGWRPSPVGRGRVRRWQLAAAIAVGAAALIAGAIWQLAGERGTPVASAAAITGRVSATFAKLQTLQAEIISAREGRPEFRTKIGLTAAGDYLLADVDGPFAAAYDSDSGVERVIGQPGFYKVDLESTGLAPGGPDASPMSYLVGWEYGALVRALLAGGDPRVTEVEYRDRPAWQLEMELDPVPGVAAKNSMETASR